MTKLSDPPAVMLIGLSLLAGIFIAFGLCTARNFVVERLRRSARPPGATVVVEKIIYEQPVRHADGVRGHDRKQGARATADRAR